MRFTTLLQRDPLRCSMCRTPLFAVSDTRFGQPPPAVLCRTCTLPAFKAAGQ